MQSGSNHLTMTVLMTPDKANFSGNVHGGTVLKYLDEVAYVRFASVYKEFSDFKSFIELIEQVKKSR